MILICIKRFWTKSDFWINKIDGLCLYNYTILKIVHAEQYIKKLIRKKSSLTAFYS